MLKKIPIMLVGIAWPMQLFICTGISTNALVIQALHLHFSLLL